MKTHHQGFIALMSVVIISAVLLVAATVGSMSSFFSRSNILDAELKARSTATADACADQAFLLVASDPTYVTVTPYILTLNPLDSCRLVISGSPTKDIKVQATSSTAVTNLRIIYDPTAFTVLSWQEVPMF